MTTKFSLLMVFILGFLSIGNTQIAKKNANIDAAVGFGSNSLSLALSWNRTHGLGSSNKFRIGYGVRLSSFSGTNLAYSTAPADLAAEASKVDTLTMAEANTIGLSALINLQYQFNEKFGIGFNIDALGFGFGGEKEGIFTTDETPSLNRSKQNASPTSSNVLLVGNNDIGQLKSEIFLFYKLKNGLGLRGGLDYTFSEYTTTKKLTQDNDRFRYKAGLVFLAINKSL
jgi:hypothetical protein